MICVDREGLDTADEKIQMWDQLTKRFKRSASSPVDVFLLNPDDPPFNGARNARESNHPDAKAMERCYQMSKAFEF